MSDDLLPCPFCGCTTIKRRDGEYPYHVCDWCGTEGPAEGLFDGMEQGWNHRVPPDTDAREAVLRGALAKAANRLDWAAGIIESNKARDQVGQWADEARAILRALEEEGRDG